jgi:hypothetical protein
MQHANLVSLIIPSSLLLFIADLAKVEEFAQHASGVALVEVIEIENFDFRPMDGNAGVRFRLRRVRGTGEFLDEIYVTTAHGGGRSGDSKPKLSAPLKPDSIAKGDKVWIAFASRYDLENHDQSIVGFWPEMDAKADSLEAAVKADTYRWSPQYEPKLKLSVGRIIEKSQWRVRAEREGAIIWERVIPGTPTDSYLHGLAEGAGGEIEVKMPTCGKILLTETNTNLVKGNEFGLPAGQYYINSGLDPETGKKHVTWIREGKQVGSAIMNLAYDPDSLNPIREQRFEIGKTGGKAVGARTDVWWGKTERTFDENGKVTMEYVYWHDESENRWVKVK